MVRFDARARRFASAAAAGCFATLASLALCACTLTAAGDAGNEPPDALDRVRALDLEPRFPQGGGTVDTGSRSGTRPMVYYGSDAPGSGRPGPAGGPSGGPGTGQAAADGEEPENSDGFELNFENTPVAAVAKVILGDVLHMGYVIDPRVQGTISLSSGRKVAKADLLFALEAALRTANAVLVRDRVGIRIVPSEDAIGSGGADGARREPEPGYGVTVIPLRHVAVPTILKLLDGFAAKAGAIRGEPSGNLIVVTGSGSERQSVLDTVRSFDADWMRGQSVGIYPIRNTTPEPLIAELEKIMDSGENGLSHSLVKFQPIGRLNAILVVARKPELLRTAGNWISRLDGSSVAATGVKVYKVRYGEARQIAKLLSDMFVGSGAAGALGDAQDQLAPGSGATGGSALDRLSGGSGTQSLLQPQGGQASTSGSGSSSVGGLGAGSGGGFGASSGGGFGGSSGGGFGADQDSQPYGALRPATAQEGAAGGGFGAAGRGGASGASAQALLPGVRILADTVNNSVLIYANQESYKIIERALNQLDRPQAQVAIDLTIAEVTLNDRLAYGVQFFVGSSNLGLGVDNGSVVNTAVGDPLAQTLPGFNLVFGNRLSPRVVINALHQFTDVKILSNPSLVVINNQVATLQVGDQVPVSTGSANVLTTQNTIVNSIDYRNTGIILRVKPRINFNGNVLLEVEQEISNVADTGTQNTLTPTISQRRVKSSILVTTGQTVLLAGLIGDTQTRSRSGIPILDQLPLIGDAFSNANRKGITRTELIIFIRPQIIRDGVDASFIAEELRSKMRGDKIGSVRPPGAIQPDPPPAIIR